MHAGEGGGVKQACKQCGRRKDFETGFYKHIHYASGRMKICKKCHCENVRENYALKAEQYRAVSRIRNARPEYVAQRKAYARTERGREVHRVSNRVNIRFKRLMAREQRAAV
jgi:ribosome-binding protein aMBF1 (putative translation factor)